MPKLDLSGIILAALQTELGLILTTNDPMRAKQQLYVARKLIGGNALRLQVRSVPGQSNKLFLVKGNQE